MNQNPSKAQNKQLICIKTNNLSWPNTNQVIKLQQEEREASRSPAVLPRSASVEAVQLDKWPSSTDNSPEDKSRGGSAQRFLI